MPSHPSVRLTLEDAVETGAAHVSHLHVRSRTMTDSSRRRVGGTLLLSIVIIAAVAFFAIIRSDKSSAQGEAPSKLAVVWTSADKEVTMKMVYMYTFNAKKQGWFDTVQFIIWGPSSKLLSEDTELQDYLRKMKDAGVEIVACKACSDMYGVSGTLVELGVDVKYMGKPLSDILKSDWKVLTF